MFVGLFTCQSIRTSSTLTAPELRLHACGSARTLYCCALSDVLANAGLLSRSSCPTHLWSQNPAQILVPTRPRFTTSEGPWLNPDLVGKWSPSPVKALPFHTQAQQNPAKALPQAQTNTILILNPSSNPFYSCFLDFPSIFTYAKCSQKIALPSLLAVLRGIL